MLLVVALPIGVGFGISTAEQAAKGKAYSAKLLAKDVEKGRRTQEQAEAVLARISAPALAGLMRRHWLIGERIPFAMEKPCAVTAADAHDIAPRGAERFVTEIFAGNAWDAAHRKG